MILSVVPPRDAEATAQRLIDALALVTKPNAPLYFADMNAIAPSSVRRIARNIEKADVPITLIDGSILGGPPRRRQTDAGLAEGQTSSNGDGGSSSSSSSAPLSLSDLWNRPSLPTSGPVAVADIPGYGPGLAEVLNTKHISPDIGASSGLKMCFASLTKGYAALAIQAFTTAEQLGVLQALQESTQEITPQRVKHTESALVSMPPKAYRWVHEMEEIARTHAEDGGFDDTLFRGAAGVFKAVAEDTVLGKEKVGKRERGQTGADVAAAMAEGLSRKRKKRD